jgi:adenosylhomocysteine nucleosidase
VAVKSSTLALVIFTLLGCGRDREPSRTEMATRETEGACAGELTLIVTAMASEVAPLLARTDVVGHTDRITCGTFAGRHAALAVVGVGPMRARDGVSVALEQVRASTVVMVGIAGAVGHELRIGDVAVPARWSRHDEGAKWFGVDEALLARARALGNAKLGACDDSSVCAMSPKLVVGGSGVTGRGFVEDPAVGADLENRLGAVVTDMETAVVAQAAREHGVPFVAVRAVSDLVWTGRSDELVESYGGLAADNAAVAAEQLLR